MQAARTVRLLLIDDHALFRRGVQFLLAALGDGVEFEEAESCAAARQFEQSRFDMVLVDLKMPGLVGLDSVTWARGCFDSAPLVVLSSEEDPDLIREAIEKGAAGFIPKASTPEVMLSALRLVLSGGIYLPPHTLRGANLSLHPVQPMRAGGQSVSLSERQREVLARAVQGKPNKIIARELGLSEGTIKAHLSAAFRALGVSNRVEAVYAAAREGLASAVAAGARK